MESSFNNLLKFPIAHRGLHGNGVCENSMQAFKNAKNRKFAIELDIHTLKDGNFAVFHDKNLQRVTGKDKLISTLSGDELKNYPLSDGQIIPLLDDVLREVNGEVPILIELKNEGNFDKKNIASLLRLLEKYNHDDMVAIQSFNPFIIRSVKKLTSKYPAGILSSRDLNNTNPLTAKILEKLMLFNFSKADFISYDIRYLPNKYVEKLKKKNVKVLSWVIDSEEKLVKAKEVADNIIFENLNSPENFYKKD